MNHKTTPSRLEDSKLLSAIEICDIIGITIGTLYTWRATKRFAVPCVKIGKLLKYRYEDVMKFINEREEVNNANE